MPNSCLRPFHVALLKTELQRRKEKNSRYSLRAFASFLKLDPSALSRILSGKQELSTPGALQIIRKLKLTNRDQERFILSVAEEKYRQALSVLSQTLEAPPNYLASQASGNRGGRYESFLSFAPDLIAVLGMDGRFVLVTPTSFPFVDLGAREIIGLTPVEAGLPPAIAEGILAQWKSVGRTRQPSIAEHQHEGETYRAFATPVTNDAGELESVLIHFRCTTREKKAAARAQALLELNAAYSSCLDPGEIARITVEWINDVASASSVTFHVVEADCLRLLAATAAPLGARASEFPRKVANLPASHPFHSRTPLFLENLPPEAGHRASATIAVLVGSRSLGYIEMEFTDRPAIAEEDRIFLITLIGVCGQALERARLFAIEQTCRLEAEKEREAFRSLFNTMNEGFCVMEKVATPPGTPSDYRYLEANQAFERHTGLSEVVGKTVRQVIPWAEEPILARYDRVVQTGKPELFEGHVSARDLWLEIGAYPIRSPGQIALIFRNISDRKRMEATLRALEAQRRLETTE